MLNVPNKTSHSAECLYDGQWFGDDNWALSHTVLLAGALKDDQRVFDIFANAKVAVL